MSSASKLFCGMALLCTAWSAAPAQTPAAPADKPSQATAQSEAGEPRATTSDSATPAPPAADPGLHRRVDGRGRQGGSDATRRRSPKRAAKRRPRGRRPPPKRTGWIWAWRP